ncbi:MAG: hypothetical protein ABUT39_11525 [Acidobacteriota bacterium]
MPSSFNFDDVVLAEAGIQEREDRDWCVVVACAQSSFRHGSDTQRTPVGRQGNNDFHVGIRTTDDLIALQLALVELRNSVAERLAQLLSEPAAESLRLSQPDVLPRPA